MSVIANSLKEGGLKIPFHHCHLGNFKPTVVELHGTSSQPLNLSKNRGERGVTFIKAKIWISWYYPITSIETDQNFHPLAYKVPRCVALFWKTCVSNKGRFFSFLVNFSEPVKFVCQGKIIFILVSKFAKTRPHLKGLITLNCNWVNYFNKLFY